MVHEKSIKNEVPIVLDIANKGKKKVFEDNTKKHQVRDNGKPSPICSDRALVIGEFSTSIVGQVVEFKHVGVVENLCKGNLLDSDIGFDAGFRNPNDPIPLNSSLEKIKEPIIFSPIPIESYNNNAKPGRPKRDLQPTLALCSPYHKKEIDTTERVSRLAERVAASVFLAIRNPRKKSMNLPMVCWYKIRDGVSHIGL
ncbi:unnamed protein product [Lactuca saligna]|uniref:Uncharacterized protein n=1 Tax=Lactuca saligna TaxID=75948 RepID=A0AA35VHR0_LACSI|nr:unnamed protein product [Lactuca saligna]